MAREGMTPNSDWVPTAVTAPISQPVSIYQYGPTPTNFNHTRGPQEHEPSLYDVIKVLRTHWKIVGLTTLLLWCAGFLYCLLATKMYTATATLEFGGYDPVIPSSSFESSYGQQTKKAEYAKTQTAKVTRLTVADTALGRGSLADDVRGYFHDEPSFIGEIIIGIKSAIGSLFSSDAADSTSGGGENFYRHDRKLLVDYMSTVGVRPVEETSLVQVAATTSDPKLSQKIANAHVQGFIDTIRGERHENTLTNLKFLESQADELRDKVAALEQDLAKYAEDNELISVSKDQNLVVSELSKLQEHLIQATAKRITTESSLKGLESSPQALPALDDESIQVLRVSLKEAEAQYADLNQRLTPAHPQMIQLSAKIGSLRETIEQQRKQALRGLRTEYESLVETESKLKTQVAALEAKAHETSRRLVKYNILQREYDSVKDLYQTVLRQLKEAQISSASTGINVSVAEHAVLPINPSSPLRGFILGISLIVGLAVGTVIAFVLHMLDNTIKSTEDVQTDLGMPALGVVPSFGPGRLPSLDQAASTPDLRVVNGDDLSDSKEIAAVKPGSKRALAGFPQAFVSEAFRTIRTSLLFSSADRPPRLIMISSAKKGDGKTTFVCNLGYSLAQASHKTLIIDADVRQAKVHERFGIPADRPGLVDYLAGQADLEMAISPTSVPNLQVLPAGAATPNPAELLGSERMAQLIESLGMQYDYILVDSPPVLPVADSLILSRIVDGIVLVVRAGETERHLAQEACRRLTQVQGNILGVVLNDADITKEFKEYGQGYTYVVPNMGEDGRRAVG